MISSRVTFANWTSPQITEAAVVGLPSEQWGQKVAAVVVLSPEAASTGRNGKAWGPMDMRRALKDRLASYKIPQEMKALNAIPRNAMGKGEFFSLTSIRAIWFLRFSLADAG
jgi:acyl-coenzyme A synthetase/AMP-(fatty) acid ligase